MKRNKPVKALWVLAFISIALRSATGQSIETTFAAVDSLNSLFDSVAIRDVGKAQEIAQKALKMSLSLQYVSGQGAANSNLGVTHARLGDYKKAAEYFFAALKRYDALKEDFRNSEKYTVLLYRLAAVLQRESDFGRALLYSNRAIELARRNDYQCLAIAYRCKGEILRQLENFDSAFYYFNTALLLLKDQNNFNQVAAIYNDLGLIHLSLKNYGQAIHYTQKAQRIMQQIGNEIQYCTGLNQIGMAYYFLDSYGKALVYLDSAQDCNRSTSENFNSALLAHIHLMKARTFQKMNNADSAGFYFEKSIALGDSLRNDNYKKELAALQTSLDMREREAENFELKASLEGQKKKELIMFTVMIGSMLIAIITGALVTIVRKNRAKRAALVLKQRHLENELMFLRAQVNPHFLFNAMNSISVLMQKNIQQANESLVHLSQLLRYQLYECSDEYVLLEKELEYLQSYVSLQKQRLGKSVAIAFKLHGDPEAFQIAPFLLIPFVENCFKHISRGVSPTPEISISIDQSNDRLMATFYNTTDVIKREEPGGLGIKNVKRRLELLYPNRHGLKIVSAGEYHKVMLDIILTTKGEAKFNKKVSGYQYIDSDNHN